MLLINLHHADHLDNKMLVQFKGTRRSIFKITTEQNRGNYFWIRMIQSDMGNVKEFIEDWKKVFKKSSPQNMKRLAEIVRKFFNNKPIRKTRNWSPMHIISEGGNLELCKTIAEITEDKNPRSSKDQWTPLHYLSVGSSVESHRVFRRD